MVVGFTSAIASHVGMVRSNNQDSGFAGKQLFFVADGMGGHAGGDVASALTTRSVAKIDDNGFETPEEAATSLKKRLLSANNMLSETVRSRQELAGMGTTFCGFITLEDKLAVAHIGDSRLYLFRDGQLTQITQDHTFVQRLVDSGRITEEEAKTHPRRSVLMRVLGDVDSAPDVDTQVLDTKPGDVWLLCSDGLAGFVEESDIEKILKRRTSLSGAVDSLIDITLSHGAPDNVTIVLVETQTEAPTEKVEPQFVGSAAHEEEAESTDTRPIHRFSKLSSVRKSKRAKPVQESHFEPRVDEYLAELIAETKREARNRRIMMLAALLVAIGAISGLLLIGYQWTQTRYFVGTDGQTVIIYRGVQQQIGSFSLSSEEENTLIPLDSLNLFQQRQVERTLDAGSIEEARDIVLRLGVQDE